MKFRILITGSRDWEDRARIETELEHYRRVSSILVSGACPTGADRIGEQVWESLGGEVERHPADWKQHGKRAGYVRNAEMVELGARVCLAFIKNASRGGSMTADLALRAGIPVTRIEQFTPADSIAMHGPLATKMLVGSIGLEYTLDNVRRLHDMAPAHGIGQCADGLWRHAAYSGGEFTVGERTVAAAAFDAIVTDAPEFWDAANPILVGQS